MLIVTKSTGSWYELLDMETGKTIKARLRGSLRLKGSRSTNPVVVGDRVAVRGDDDDSCVIEEVLPRTNYIIRRASNLSKESHILASNIDRVYIVATAAHPATSPEFIDRVLVTAELYNIEAVILINKVDIDAGDMFREIYEKTPYRLVGISALTGEGVDDFKKEIKGKTILFAGNSGVGKSTLINAINPSIMARTGAISEAHNKGRHTTTFSEIFRFGDGFLIDTPGVKGFGLLDIEPTDLWKSMPDLMHYGANCAFNDCTHTHEPSCAVIAAVENGDIHPWRYESYLKMIDQDGGKYR